MQQLVIFPDLDWRQWLHFFPIRRYLGLNWIIERGSDRRGCSSITGLFCVFVSCFLSYMLHLLHKSYLLYAYMLKKTCYFAWSAFAKCFQRLMRLEILQGSHREAHHSRLLLQRARSFCYQIPEFELDKVSRCVSLRENLWVVKGKGRRAKRVS